jgi:hypothetical protein
VLRPAAPPATLGWAHLAALVYVGLAVLLFAAAWRDPTRLAIGGGSQDPYQKMWFLGWVSHAAGLGGNPLLTDHVDYPAGVNLAWNNLTILPGLLITPVIRRSPVLAWNLLVTASLPLSAWAAFAAIHRLVPHRLGAWVGGLLYGFSPYMMVQGAGHLNMIMVWTPPLVLFLLHDLLVRRRLSSLVIGAVLGLLVAAQEYTTLEVMLTTAIMAAAGLAALAAVARPGGDVLRSAARSLLRAGAPALAMSGVLSAPLVLTMWRGPGRLVRAVIQTPDTYVTDLVGLAVPTRRMLIAPGWSLTTGFTGNPFEWDSYVGILLLSVLAWTVWRWRGDRVVRWAGATAAIAVVLSLGPHLHVAGRVLPIPLPMRLVEHVPLFDNILPTRLMVFFQLCAGVLLAVFVRHVHLYRSPVGATAWLASSLLALTPAAAPTTTTDIPPFFTGNAATEIPAGSVALVAPYADSSDSTAMLWQAASGYRFKMPEGYAIRRTPRGISFDPDSSTLGDALRAVASGQPAATSIPRMRCELASWHVRTVIVGPMRGQSKTLLLLREVTGRPPRRQGGVWVWRDLGRLC